MRLLIDEALSQRVADLLTAGDHNAIHVAELGLLGATDEQVMRAAADDDRVLVSVDTDFGGLLALGRHPGPSVVLLRRAPHRPAEQAALLLRNLPSLAGPLGAGAIAVLTAERIRVRLLPIP